MKRDTHVGPSAPHGGKSVWKVADGEQRKKRLEQAAGFPVLTVDAAVLSDVLLIAVGAFAPLTGFMTEADYRSVRDEMRLAPGWGWSLPVTLPAPEDREKEWRRAESVTLADPSGKLTAIVRVESVFRIDPGCF